METKRLSRALSQKLFLPVKRGADRLLSKCPQTHTIHPRHTYVFIAILASLALVCRFLPENVPLFAAFKLIFSTLAIGIVPGMLLLLLVHPIAKMSALETVGIGIAVSFGLIQILTIISLLLHIPVVTLSLILDGLCIIAPLPLLLMRYHMKDEIYLGRQEATIALLLVILAFFLYLQGSPFGLLEDQIHIGVIRRLAFLEHLSINNIYITPDLIYTYPFPCTHFFFAMISRLGEIDPLFVYHKLRFFWGPTAIIFLYLVGRLLFKKIPSLPFVVTLTALLFVANGSFAAVPNFYWAQLVPYSHASDVAMGVLLPGLMVLALFYFSAENKRGWSFFFAASLLLVVMLTIVHIRETVQLLVYLGSFFLGVLIFRRDKLLLKRTLLLAISVIVIVIIYLAWYRNAVSPVDTITFQRRALLVEFVRGLNFSDFFNQPFHFLDKNHYWSVAFEPLFYGWNPVIILFSPAILWFLRKHRFLLLIGVSIFIYVLIIRFPVLSIPYIYLTYYEILFTPIRNIIFFIFLLTGVLFYIIAVYLATIRNKLLAATTTLVAVLCLGLCWSHGGKFFQDHVDLFFLPVLVLYLAASIFLNKKTEPREERLLTPPPKWSFFCAALLLVLAVWTSVPASSPISQKFDAHTFSLNPKTLIDSIPCNKQTCSPDYHIMLWASKNLPIDAVLAIDMKNEALPSLVLPYQVNAWPVPSVGSEFHRLNFPKFYYYYDVSMKKYGVQPLFNSKETIEERLAFIRGLKITHILVDPMYFEETKATLSQWPNIFKQLYDDGRWAIYQVVSN